MNASMTITYRKIALSPAQAEMWDWAVDPMLDFWASNEEREDDSKTYDQAIHYARDGVGLIVDDPDVADDLIYRVETQMEQMSYEEGGYDHRGRADKQRMVALRAITIGRQVAAKVRKAFGLEEA